MKLLTLLSLLSVAAAQQNKIYQGFNTGAALDGTKPKTQADFEAEFTAAQALHYSPGVFNSARLYTNVQFGTSNTPIAAFQAAINTNTSLLLGIWCSGTTSIDNELKALTTAITQYGSKFTNLVLGISVGSEDLYRLSESGIANKAGIGAGPTAITTFIKSVRATLSNTPLSSIPIGHVDSWSAWANTSNSAVVEASDFLGMDLYPYYEKNLGNDISNATAIFEDLHKQTLSASSGKPVWITETGWPVSGSASGKAVPSVENARAYWGAVACKYVGRVNVWWYTLRDADSAIQEKFAISKSLSADTSFNLTCPAGSGAPTSVNIDASKGVKKSSAGYSGVSMVGVVLSLSAGVFGALL
ncbi:GPI-anchored cell wall beta-1,3-endoglucanase EglC [Tricladium varicosporioides]|nr:GPI-anchored cell wall beta-1,3-endoglucanase EglC [Hymenoscyphus varicosporioides]